MAWKRTAARVVVTTSGILPTRCQLRATAKDAPVVVFTAEGNRAKLGGWADDGAEVIERGLWTPEEMAARDLPGRFGYVLSPAALRQSSAVA